jgi:hypothetical protein
MVGILWMAQRLQVIIVFVDPTLLTLVSLFFLFFRLGLIVLRPQQLYGMVAIAGRKPVSRKNMVYTGNRSTAW